MTVRFFGTTINDECADQALNKLYQTTDGLWRSGRQIEELVSAGKLTPDNGDQVLVYGLELQQARDRRRDAGLKALSMQEIKNKVRSLHQKACGDRAHIEAERSKALEELSNLPSGISSISRQDAEAMISAAYRSSLSEMQKPISEAVNDLKETVSEYMREYYRPRPEMLEQNVIALMNSITMTPTEIDGMLDRYKSNPTMCRAVLEHAVRHGIRTDKTVMATYDITNAGHDQAEGINLMLKRIENISAGDQSTYAVWKDPELFSREYDRLTHHVESVCMPE